MKNNLSMFIGFISLLALSGCQKSNTEPTYLAVSLFGISINVDGQLDEEIWKNAYWETGFSFPWQSMETPSTSFSSLRSEDHLYFAFKVKDDDIVFASGSVEDEKGVAKGDRVEIFFSRDKALDEYYCLEISPKGRVLDYRASYYREFDHSWSCDGLQISTQVLEDGYVVEGSIPLDTFTALGLIAKEEQNRILTGLFRGEFSHGPGETINQRWISWILPDSETPDFHIPSAFGYLEIAGR